jgi:alpha-amylase
MQDIFEELKTQVGNIGKELSPEEGDAAITILHDWLEKNSEELVARKNVKEFNGTMMQWFHWYTNDDGNHWRSLAAKAPQLARAGISALWLPPAYKGMGGIKEVGYAAYDLYDLGEFDQKGTIRTKYGTKDEYLEAIKSCKNYNINVYADVVFNHKIGADQEEEFDAIPIDMANRNHALGPARPIRSWTNFKFPGRQGKYSAMEWSWYHFDSVDYNSLDPGFHAVWQLKDKPLEGNVNLERGNYDFLMGCDLDIAHPEVISDLKAWGEWSLDHVGVDGFRLDAIKHVDSDFFVNWINHIENHAQRDVFIVGEYWTYDLGTLSWYASQSAGKMSLFDAPLHFNFHRASQAGGNFDMRTILDGTLMKEIPLLAVTLVENHDTQPLQALESVVEDWFKPLAYAIILLRAEGYPCIFYPDYYGATYKDFGPDGNEHEIVLASHRSIIDLLLLARRFFAYGEQRDYFDDANVIGWSRLGTESHPHTLAVVLSDGIEGRKWMDVGKTHTRYRDLTGHCPESIETNEDGWGEFRCNGGSVSVWVEVTCLPSGF